VAVALWVVVFETTAVELGLAFTLVAVVCPSLKKLVIGFDTFAAAVALPLPLPRFFSFWERCVFAPCFMAGGGVLDGRMGDGVLDGRMGDGVFARFFAFPWRTTI
jgi:hypothetical protein